MCGAYSLVLRPLPMQLCVAYSMLNHSYYKQWEAGQSCANKAMELTHAVSSLITSLIR